MDQGVWEIAIEREQSRGSRPSSGVVVGVVGGFDGAFAVFSMSCSAPSCELLRDALQEKVSLNWTSQKEELVLEFENTIAIERPIDELFAFLSDFENIAKWNYYVLEVRQLSESPIGIGTTYHQLRKSDQQ